MWGNILNTSTHLINYVSCLGEYPAINTTTRIPKLCTYTERQKSSWARGGPDTENEKVWGITGKMIGRKKTNTSRQIKTSYPYIFDSGTWEIILSLDISNIQYSIYIWPQRCKRKSLKIASKSNLAHLLTSMTVMQKIYKELVISYSKLSQVTLWAFYFQLNDFF